MSLIVLSSIPVRSDNSALVIALSCPVLMYYTSTGDIRDQSKLENRKQERQARLHGYNRLIGLVGIIHAFNAGCQNKYEIADFLDVTEEYLEECISCYRDKYGVYTTVDNYIIYFIPNLVVVEMM